MRVVVIGATGHIGGYLVPRLVGAGHEVVAISRNGQPRYRADPAWEKVTQVRADRDAEDAAGSFGQRVAGLQADAVVDLICFQAASAHQLVEALRPRGTYLLHCGTIWVHGPSTLVPVTEEAPRRPFGEYGVHKAEIEQLLLAETAGGGLPATLLHPGHIVGPGWLPLNPAGNFSPAVFERLAAGEELALANLGMESVHHVHADDVAQAFARALERPEVAIGQSFHVVSERAVTLRGYAEAVAEMFGQPSRLSFVPWETWQSGVSPDEARATFDHIAHSPSMSITKAGALLGYVPAHSSLAAVAESLDWLVGEGSLETGGRRPQPPGR